jgi:hypothetical protein
MLQTRPGVQRPPHIPQLSGSMFVSTQKPPQLVEPDGQTQLPATQMVPPPQTRPQPPQLSGLMAVFTQLCPQRV